MDGGDGHYLVHLLPEGIISIYHMVGGPCMLDQCNRRKQFVMPVQVVNIILAEAAARGPAHGWHDRIRNSTPRSSSRKDEVAGDLRAKAVTQF